MRFTTKNALLTVAGRIDDFLCSVLNYAFRGRICVEVAWAHMRCPRVGLLFTGDKQANYGRTDQSVNVRR